MSNSSRKHKKKEESIEYHFSDSVGKVINLEIPAEKVSLLFQSLSVLSKFSYILALV